MISIKRGASIALVAGAAFAASTVALAGTDDASSTAKTASSGIVTPTAEVTRSFGAFRGATAGDQAGIPVFNVTSRPGTDQNVVGLPFAVQATTFPDGRSLWLSTKGQTVCTFYVPRGADTPAGGCDDASTLARVGGTTSSVYSDSDIDLAGTVPDGVDTVQINLHGKKSIVVLVKRNGYAVHLTALPRSIEFVTKNGDKIEQPQFANATFD